MRQRLFDFVKVPEKKNLSLVPRLEELTAEQRAQVIDRLARVIAKAGAQGRKEVGDE